jgi:transcriptional enhancer factor
MEYWPSDMSIPSSHSVEQRPIRGPNPLKAVSGNRQNFALDRHAGPENQNPQELYYINSSFTKTKHPSNTIPTTATLGSNDTERAAHRRHRQHVSSIDPRYQDRSYLNSEKYQEYRARQRKDLGQDNKQVWSDDVEEAFQEGPLLSTQLAEVLTRSSTF